MKIRLCIFFLLVIALSACTSMKNTAGTRWYHSFNTRYNIYFNGNEAYKEAEKNQIEAYISTENFSEFLEFHPVSATPENKTTSGGPYTKSIEKAIKAIKLHSIQTKPENDGTKKKTAETKAFMKRTEFNPFLHNAWTMMAKSQFFNGDFLEAASTFSYISRLYDTQPEISTSAKIWKARCYNEMGWYYDAENILNKIDSARMTKSQNNLYQTVYADYYVKQKLWNEAIPFLKNSIKAEKNKLQRNREKYLLAQIYAATDRYDEAYRLFGQVAGATVPYILQLNARIRQTEFITPGNNVNKLAKRLKRMAKSSKNKEYLDMVYYALGNIYMLAPDTAKAVESYELGVEKSTRGGIDRAMNQIRLGDIYFTQQQYVKAQPNYSEALGQLKKEDAAYPRVAKRSEALDALVVHAEAVELQDSLQRLSRMSEDERLAVVKKIIEDLKKKEKEEREKAEQAEYQAQRDELQSQRNQQSRQKLPTTVAAPSDGSFYFYNPQAVTNGRNVFQQKWGRRKLEDDWRRRNKQKLFDDTTEDETAETDANAAQNQQDQSLAEDSLSSDQTAAPTESAEEKTLSDDPYDPQFYLQQIPVTEEEIEASNLILQDGLFNMGLILKDYLEDYPLALQTFDSLNIRFPENENKLEAYHHTYLIYWKLDDMLNAEIYKQKIRTEFPTSELAVALADPNYEYNQKMMPVIQDSLYRSAFEGYQEGKPLEIRELYDSFTHKYSDTKLTPKFMFINALSYAQTMDADSFKVRLKELIDRYPNEDVSLLAADMMKGFQRGLLLSASGDGMLARGSIFNLRFGDENAQANDSTLIFSAETKTPHKLLLLYPKGSVNENLLLFDVASYNFSKFSVNDYDLTLNPTGNIGMLQIDGFRSLEEVLHYYDMINSDDGYALNLDDAVIIVPVSTANYEILMRGKSLESYMTFFEENLGEGNEDIVELWKLQAEEEKKVKEEKETAKVDSNLDNEEELPETADSISETISETPEKNIFSEQSDSIRTETIDETNALDEIDPFEAASDISEKIEEIANDPLKAITNLFTRKKKNAIDEYAEQQEKAEKERLKQLRKEKLEREKQQLIEQREQEKLQREQEKAAAKLQREQEKLAKEQAKQAEREKKQKIEERKKAAKEKAKARAEAKKQRKAEQKAKAKKK